MSKNLINKTENVYERNEVSEIIAMNYNYISFNSSDFIEFSFNVK